MSKTKTTEKYVRSLLGLDEPAAPFREEPDFNALSFHLGRSVELNKPKLQYKLKEKGGPRTIERPPPVEQAKPKYELKKKKNLALQSVFTECEEQVKERFSSCVLGALSTSKYSDIEDAVREVGRSPINFVILTFALATEETMISTIMLKSENKNQLTEHMKKDFEHMKCLLQKEFKMTKTTMKTARNYADRLIKCGFEIPEMYLKMLDCLIQESENNE